MLHTWKYRNIHLNGTEKVFAILLILFYNTIILNFKTLWGFGRWLTPSFL